MREHHRVGGRISFQLIAVLAGIFLAGLVLSLLISSTHWERKPGNTSRRSTDVVTDEDPREPGVLSPTPVAIGEAITVVDRQRNQETRWRRTTEAEAESRLNRSRAGTLERGASTNGEPGSEAQLSAENESSERDPEELEPEEPGEEEERSANLSGWVFDESGSGVPELLVAAEGRRLVGEAAGTAAGASRSASARTDGEGYFAVVGLIEGEYSVRTESTDRYESVTGMYRAGVDSAVLVVSEKTGRRVIVRGFVESAHGGSLEAVQVVPVGQFENRASTDSQGAYEMRLDVDSRQAQSVRYLSEGFREHRLSIDDAELRADSDIIRNVILEPSRETSTVSGQVVDGDGARVQRAHVQLYSASIGRRADGSSDQEGLFSIPDVEHSDDYRLWVRPPSGYRDYVEEDLVVTGRVDLDIVVEGVGWSSLEGQMLDPDGRPVPGFTLWLRTASESGQLLMPVTGDEQGYFSVDRLPDGGAALQTQASPFLGFSGIELAPGVAQFIRLRLDTGGHNLGGFVLDDADAPVAGARIVLLWSVIEDGVRSRSKRETFADANGYFLFTMLGSGRHTLNVSANGFRSSRLEYDVSMGSEEILINLGEAFF